MVTSEHTEKELYEKHQTLCNKLNLEPEISSTSWEIFQSINKNYGLEGDTLHWLGCSVYVAAQRVETPTVDSNNVVRGNGLSLTALLRHSNLSFAQFFSNITKWAEMTQLPQEFHTKVSYLRSTFSVAYNTFKKFHPMFCAIFMPPNTNEFEQSQHKSRKAKCVPCTSYKLLEFVWNLFLVLKAELSTCSTELVKSYNLLDACVDFVFKNAFLANRRDLLNPNFEVLPSNWNSPNYTVPTEAPCLVKHYCQVQSILTEALHTKVYILKNLLRKLVDSKTLIGNVDTMTDFLNVENFDYNFRNINNAYETHLLMNLDFDERIFLAEYRRRLLEKEMSTILPSGIRNMTSIESGETAFDSPRVNLDMSTPRGLRTPLTGRGYLGPRDPEAPSLNTDAAALMRLTSLNNILSLRPTGPTETLLQIFQSCKTNPKPIIDKITESLESKFISVYTANNSDLEVEAKRRIQDANKLFYKFVENILQNEQSMRPDITPLVVKELFYQCMFACCMELVLFCHTQSQRKFPWILETLEIEALHFVKVIELIVRSKDQLSREMIKHLNRIEETCMEALIWKSNSCLWDALKHCGQDIPKCEETALNSHILRQNESNGNYTSIVSRITKVPESPAPSAVDRFQSPVANVSRNLFPTGNNQSLLQKHTHLIILDNDGNKKLIPILENDSEAVENTNVEISENTANNVSSSVPKRTGSLAIIFRKFYNLAGLRMENLCDKLPTIDLELRKKIWTVFEHSVTRTDLIRDRHLDQLLMCAVYVICRVCENPLRFTDIMKYYREQPQAGNSVYRDVLIERQTLKNDGTIAETEKRRDLIYFYNSKYVEVMQSFAVRFQVNNSQSNRTSTHLLSPLPACKRYQISPSIYVGDNVFVKPMDSPNLASGPSYNYYFSRSPSKDLLNINRAINHCGIISKKRKLMTDGESDQRIAKKKLEMLVEDRRNQANE